MGRGGRSGGGRSHSHSSHGRSMAPGRSGRTNTSTAVSHSFHSHNHSTPVGHSAQGHRYFNNSRPFFGYSNHYYSSRYRTGTSGNCFVDWSSIIVVVCLAFIIIGGLLVRSGMGNQRYSLVSQYNGAVQQWKSKYYTEFDTISDKTMTANGWSLNKVHPLDLLEENDKRGIETYNTLAHEVDIAKPVSSKKTLDFNLTVNDIKYSFNLPVQITVSKGKEQFVGTNCREYGECSSLLDDDEVEKCFERPYCSDICTDELRGSWDSGNCTATAYLNEVCFAVELSSKWILNKLSQTVSPVLILDAMMRSGNLGCYYITDSLFFDINAFYPGLYELDKMTSIKFRVRHAKDPYILADRITLGSLNFGPVSNENVGYGFLAAGIVLLVVFIIKRKISTRSVNEATPKQVVETTALPVVTVTAPVLFPGVQGTSDVHPNAHTESPFPSNPQAFNLQPMATPIPSSPQSAESIPLPQYVSDPPKYEPPPY